MGEDGDLISLVTRAQGGDLRAFDALVRRFQDRAVGYARSLLPDRWLAEDAAQEAFVEAFRCLPRLRAPAAFPALLRRIIRKQCDRVRRVRRPPLVPLEAAALAAGGPEPLSLVLAEERAACLYAALDGLPPAERAAALLYYLGGSDIAGIAAFLGLPKTTVKNRLHAARQRLRKELWEMAEEVLKREKPSRGDAFAGRVLSEIVAEFERQRRADPHTADRGLLAAAREKLDAALAQEQPLDWETVRAGFRLLIQQNDRNGLAGLLTRYLAQWPPDSEAIWAHYHRVNWLASAGQAAEAVTAQEEMEAALPGKSARLSVHWPYWPLGESAEEEALPGDALTFWALGKSGEFALAYRKAGREEEYFRKVEAAFRAIPPSPGNRWFRFACLRLSCMLCETARRAEAARGYIARMAALAEEESDPAAAADWRIKALNHELNLLRILGEEEAFRETAWTITGRLAAVDAPWVRDERHDLACHLAWDGHYEPALALLEQNLSSGGHVNAWAYLMHASVCWAQTGDRARTLSLIREAAVRDNRDVTDLMREMRPFENVHDDPEFLAAARK